MDARSNLALGTTEMPMVLEEGCRTDRERAGDSSVFE